MFSHYRQHIFYAEIAENYSFQLKNEIIKFAPTLRVKNMIFSICQHLLFLPDLLIFAISLNFALLVSRYRLLSAA